MRVEKVAQLPTEELMARIDSVPVRKGAPYTREAAALLGAAKEPEITVSRALNLYWDLAREARFGKSDDQIRKWKSPHKKAVRTFIDVVGDKAISAITGDDMLDFRAWWLDRIQNEGLSPGSANKDLIHLGKVLKTVNNMKRLNLMLPLSDLSFKEGAAEPRPPFSEKWIRGVIVAPGALANLNKDARCIVLAMVNTGARPSELASLTRDQIHLNDDVPHISVEPVERQLKSANAKRVIPLCGISLDAMRASRDGFPRYRDSSASLSAAVNK